MEDGYAPAKALSARTSGCLSAAVREAEKEYSSETEGCSKVGKVDTEAGPVCIQVVAGRKYVFNFSIKCPSTTVFFQATCYDGPNAPAKIDSVVYGTSV
jgi:hypothetical protein